MSGYKFSAAERLAIYSVHGGSCYLCGAPLDLTTMCVDHILPDSLSAEPNRLAQCLRDFGLPESFNLNSFENWLPACRRCNGQKSSKPLRATPIIQIQIDRASSRAALVREHIARSASNQEISKAMATLEKARDARQIPVSLIETLVVKFDEGRPKSGNSDEGPIEFRLSPYLKVLYEANTHRIVLTQWGAGYVPKGEVIDPSFYCGNCGSLGPWSGAMCLSCGQMIEDG
jgi:5-methylcytosine-specific restriction endonuclease McrA